MQNLSIIIYLLSFLFGSNIAIKVFESTVPLEVENLISGLRYKRPDNEKVTLSNSLTICIRFNLKRLGYGQPLKLFAIGSSKLKDEPQGILNKNMSLT